MSIAIKSKTVDLVFSKNAKGDLRGHVAKEDYKFAPNTKAIKLHYSLMGELSPLISPLSPNFSADNKENLYRFDWFVGITPFSPCYEWNWFDGIDGIAAERALVVQLLIDSEEAGCGVCEFNALLMGLLPSKDTASFLETHISKLGDSLDKLSNFANSFSTVGANILRTSAIVSNFVVSDEKGQKNWFVYRFLDEKRNCSAVEYNIHRTVLQQYGPALRGSILLTFHGEPKPGGDLALLLRPRLHFGDKNQMGYDPPEEELEKENPVELRLTPRLA
jgi:hypothetical protein